MLFGRNGFELVTEFREAQELDVCRRGNGKLIVGVAGECKRLFGITPFGATPYATLSDT